MSLCVLNMTGRLGGDAEVREVGGSKVVEFSVATDSYRGEAKGRVTQWTRCSWWGDRAVKLAQYIRKGEQVSVLGRLELDEIADSKGVYVRCRVIDVALGSKPEGQRDGGAGRSQPRQQPRRSSGPGDFAV